MNKNIIDNPFKLPARNTPGISLNEYIDLLKTKVNKLYMPLADKEYIVKHKLFYGHAHHIRSLGGGSGCYFFKDDYSTEYPLEQNGIKIDTKSIYSGLIIKQWIYTVNVLVNLSNPFEEAYVRIETGYCKYSEWFQWTDQLLNVDKNNLSCLMDCHL